MGTSDKLTSAASRIFGLELEGLTQKIRSLRWHGSLSALLDRRCRTLLIQAAGYAPPAAQYTPRRLTLIDTREKNKTVVLVTGGTPTDPAPSPAGVRDVDVPGGGGLRGCAPADTRHQCRVNFLSALSVRALLSITGSYGFGPCLHGEGARGALRVPEQGSVVLQ